MRAKSLRERVKEIQQEADAFIDARAKAVSENCPGVPLAVLRQLITNRFPGCQCNQALAEMEKEAAQ